jgi:hypothetical protein
MMPMFDQNLTPKRPRLLESQYLCGVHAGGCGLRGRAGRNPAVLTAAPADFGCQRALSRAIFRSRPCAGFQTHLCKSLSAIAQRAKADAPSVVDSSSGRVVGAGFQGAAPGHCRRKLSKSGISPRIRRTENRSCAEGSGFYSSTGARSGSGPFGARIGGRRGGIGRRARLKIVFLTVSSPLTPLLGNAQNHYIYC